MNPRILLGAFALVVGLVAPALGAVERPNIIFILADDIGIPGIGCYGGGFKTPNLDAMAAGGMRFQNCFAAPLCAPSRAMLMTGRYAFRTGVTNNGQGANATPEKDGCVAQLMKQAGYATAVAGKWRQLAHFATQSEGAKWGFDEFLTWGAVGDDDEGGKRKKNFDGTKAKLSRYWDPNYNFNGKPLADTKGKYGPDLLQNFVLDFIRRHQDGPFFIYYPMPLIHSPILPTPDSPPGAKKGRKGSSVYADNIAYMDKQVGQILAELDKLKMREKTLVVFTGDNGSVGEQPVNGRNVQGGKHTMFEGGSRVPLIASWPGTIPAGVVKPDLVDFSDMLPTFAELAGAKLPPERKIDGHSYAAQLRGEKGQPREWAYVHLSDERYVRSERWKLMGNGKFFDMREAPHRQIPVAPDAMDADAKAAREKLQLALNDLKSQDTGMAGKKRKKKK